MPFLIGPMSKKIRSEKHLTEHSEVLYHNPEIIALPLTTGAQEGKPLVQVGDHVKLGQMVGLRDDRFYVPFFSPVSGEVIGFEKRMSARLKPCDHVIIKNDFKDEPEYLENVIDENASKEEIIDFMKRIGLLGQGGAGFPAYIKYNTDKCECLIINAVECEPYLTADMLNIETHYDEFLLGVRMMFKASGAKECKIGIKKYHTEMIKKLNELFKDDEKINVCPVRDVYPMGWERTLVFELMKKRYGMLPIEAGAIVSNATSAITLAEAMMTKLPMHKRIVTVSGEQLNEPHNIICPLGTSIHDLLELCGGCKCENVNILMGGPMMGTCVTKDEVCINTITNGVTIYKHKEIEAMPCLRCGRCVEHCPSSLEPVSIKEAFKINDVDRLEHLHVMDCVECGMCTYICPSKIEVTEEVRRAKRFYGLRRKK
ncbi:MAG: RnfABCDGE type electron transport complex subunit C [Erysipelotrichaceae bacterium]|nr:RnfABCDGE type electron transport complex subunit C [Erysipelotrichaceae bacterium]